MPIPKSSKEIVKNCKSSLDELKAIDVCSFEVEEISSFTSFSTTKVETKRDAINVKIDIFLIFLPILSSA